MEVYEIVKSIGGGSFGQVYLARHKREEKQYVIKKIKTRDMSQKDKENTENEVRLLRELRHTNIVAYKDSYLDRDQQYLNIVMIYCEGGDMYNKIKSAKGKNFPEVQILDWLAQMALALYYLHEKKILHRDLKTQNIFLKHGRVRLGDFGIAKILDSTRDFANTCIGTPYYMSPELFKYKPYSYKSDIWAFGCILYEMCNLRHAFDAQSLNGLAMKILKGSYPPLTPTYSKQLRKLIVQMLSIDPKQRPTIWDILNKSFIKKRIIVYMAEIFSGNYPEANQFQNDVDDTYIDSLRDQAEKLGIYSHVQKQIAGENIQDEQLDSNSVQSKESGKKDVLTLQQKRELQKELKEKKRLEEEIKKLEKKNQLQSVNKRLSQKQQQQQNQKLEIQQQQLVQQQQQQAQKIKDKEASLQEAEIANQTPDTRQNAKKAGQQQNQQKEQESKGRSFSLEKRKEKDNSLEPAKKEKNYQIKINKSKFSQDAKSKKSVSQKDSSTISTSTGISDNNEDIIQYHQKSKSITDDMGLIQNNQGQSSLQSAQEEEKQSNGNVNRRQQVLEDKIRKKQEEQQKWEKQVKQIHQDNAKMRVHAAQKKAAQYRPSTGMRNMIGDEQNQNQQQSENQYEDGQQNKQIEEEIQEDEQYQNQQMQDQEQLELQNLQIQSQQQQLQIDILKKNLEAEIELKKPKIIHIQEEYAMDQEEEYMEENFEQDEKIIQEEDNEDDSEIEETEQQDENEIQKKLVLLKTKVQEKTLRINELKESLHLTKNLNPKLTQVDLLPEDIDILNEIDEDSELDNNEQNAEDIDKKLEDYDENEGQVPQEGKLNYNPQYYKVQDRIKLIRHRCEAGLGNEILGKAYDYLKEQGPNLKNDEIRKYLIEVLGEEMIGFWHLIDQILQLEELLTTIPQVMKA